MKTFKLKEGWYAKENLEDFDLSSPGIYEWEVEGVGIYVGKAKKLRERIRAYPNNVRRMLEGLHWHGNPNKKYRTVHHALRSAYEAETIVRVRVLEVCAVEERKQREEHWIARRRAEQQLGGPQVLND